MSTPPKLITKVLALEYIEIAELVPDNWRFTEDEQKCCHQSRRSSRRGPVTDILLWIECYSSLVTILGSRFPTKIGELMAYQRTIVKAHKTFIGEGWITYDACYRRKAALTKSLDWGQVDFTLYNETFTGRAKSLPRCQYCLSEYHMSASCSYAPDNPPSPPARPRQDHASRSVQLCQLYNHRYGSRCTFTPCKFAHMCSECHGTCHGTHPVSSCARLRPPPTKFPRAESPGRGKK